jgi:ubiquinone/menaquinone biosynthesis C-methylase UbiE
MVCVLIHKRSNQNILDVGYVTGVFASGWAGDHQVACVGFPLNMLMLARQKGLKVFMGDIHSLSFASDQFDIVVKEEVIQHLKYMPPAMSELVRATKPAVP